MLWIFKWDRVSGVTSVMSGIYEMCRDNLTAAIDEGFAAIALVQQMKSLYGGLSSNITKGLEWLSYIETSLEYEENLFETLAWYRAYFLNYYAWLDTGKLSYKRAWKSALVSFKDMQLGDGKETG